MSSVRKAARMTMPLAAVAMFLFGGWTVRNKLAADRQGDWVRARRGDIVSGIEVTGTLVSTASQRLGPPPLPDVWDFKVSMLAPEGSDVKKGQPVLAFDTSDLQRRLEQKAAEADEARKQIDKETAELALNTRNERLRLVEAEARLRKAALKLEAPADVAATNARRATRIEFAIATREAAAVRERLSALERAAVARVALLRSRLREAEASVATATGAIRQMQVVSPRDGSVIYVTDWRGEKKKIGDNVWRADTVIEIPDLTKMKAEGEVDEVDAGRVATGQRVVLRVDALPDEQFAGTITRVGRTVQQKRGTTDPIKVLRVDIALDRTDPAKMRPGMRFNGTIELGRARNVVLVPRDAVFLSADGPFVHRRGRLAVEQIPVRLGRESSDDVEILSGIEPGDRVLVPRDETEAES